MSIRPKNWKRFQHFKDRRPPWVKLYRDLLDDIDWHGLDGEAAKFLVQLWLLASEHDDGDLPPVEVIAFRFRMKPAEVKARLSAVSAWLEHDDIATISDRYQDDPPETETETETEQYVEAFGELWQIHHKGSKVEALKQYRRALKQTDHATIVQGLKAYVASFRGDFTGAHLFRWLRDERWQETTEAPQADVKAHLEAQRRIING